MNEVVSVCLIFNVNNLLMYLFYFFNKRYESKIFFCCLYIIFVVWFHLNINEHDY